MESKSYIAVPPGESIREQLDIRNMNQKEFALRMNMSEKHVSNLLNGKVSLTNDVANRLERVLGVPARFWNRLESLYREDLAKVETENLADKEINFINSFPYNDMVKAHIVDKASNHVDRHINLCQFFEVANLSLLDDMRLLPIVCRQYGQGYASEISDSSICKITSKGYKFVPLFKRKVISMYCFFKTIYQM